MFGPTETNSSLRRCSSAAVFAALLVGCREAPQPAPIRIAAASDLSFAFAEMGRLFEQRTRQRVVFSFGASGLLARQLAEGAPFDLYAAANVAFVDQVVRAGACDGSTRARYARGRLALWTRDDRELPRDLRELTGERFRRIAIANPEHAPYGRAAQQALTRLGVWDELAPKLVYAENVRQALQFAESGNADVAIVALALALVSKGGRHDVIDASLYTPLEQALVLCGDGPNRAGAARFAELIQSPEGRAVMQRYGFVVPAQTP